MFARNTEYIIFRIYQNFENVVSNSVIYSYYTCHYLFVHNCYSVNGFIKFENDYHNIKCKCSVVTL